MKKAFFGLICLMMVLPFINCVTQGEDGCQWVVVEKISQPAEPFVALDPASGLFETEKGTCLIVVKRRSDIVAVRKGISVGLAIGDCYFSKKGDRVVYAGVCL